MLFRSPTTAKAYDIPETYVAELNLQQLVATEAGGVTYEAVSKFPAVSRRSEERRVGKECRSRWSPYH